MPATVILNAYRSEIFKPPLCENRRHDLIFVGRLIRGKGVQVLIDAVRELERRGIRRKLTIVGAGPDGPEFMRAAEGLPITFIGVKRDRELSEIIADHKILVVPSLEPEPFGIVALEGLACGCLVVASASWRTSGSDRSARCPVRAWQPNCASRGNTCGGCSARAAGRSGQYLKQHEAGYVASQVPSSHGDSDR